VRERVNERPRTDLGLKPVVVDRSGFSRDGLDGHLAAGLRAVDRNLSRIGDPDRYTQRVRQEGGE